MQLYTFIHVLQVFILGFLGGFFMGGLLISKLKSTTSGRVTEKKSIKQSTKTNTQCANTEYPIVSLKNY